MKDQFAGGGIVVDNAIGFWIHRVYQATRNEMFRRFREIGEDVTPEQWAVLIRLWEQDARTQSDLSDATFRDRPTMSRILDGMQERGYVEREVDAKDSRVRIVKLTRRGRALQKKLVPVVQSLVEGAVKGIADEDLVTTRATLRKMFDNVER
ncbi:MAG TPA: MarR family winged helix-turn-helix transcriptional regulator [Polyangiales bacterium]|nr:MarR family winged helix-turn-helix transcriptional regulator [Polyangiales bacterium]